MQLNKTCPIIEQYLGYLSIIKNRSENTILEYRTDSLMFFSYTMNSRNINITDNNFAQVDVEFIKSIQLHDMHSFIINCQENLNSSAGTRARKIVSIRQFGSILRQRHMLFNNIAGELEC